VYTRWDAFLIQIVQYGKMRIGHADRKISKSGLGVALNLGASCFGDGDSVRVVHLETIVSTFLSIV